ncbi:MAG: biopolymer transporter ExbD [Thiobacillus sp. 63-78]|uniref:ExbD/TolR family protein n=1 Tax=Thiobacillus sp. 63-78 TaxID=1895859 RepID=UPI0008699DF6|nr:biopolymer transporter ExbD [Thiobacillus sp. 63-78]MBN8762924.1 biopolymer transporter ExbD [Thiobacillus sp.]ODV13594.1 MAG: biopolymer transporter ExbD [Thiobacillus sp. SCN 64-317]MBN8765482.1 biopolymer transporter ExbD [Thiobacillus sp.]MBN8773667.1 biopolymer transporter ExbD [Thiobacillus sp.]OJZ16587.1 MAG: biopolymer transporter ExbD [Thiobacillus sp. 63-78]
MNFRRGRREDYPEINLIPFIDILLVIVIFLAVTTTYARFAELKINLPTSSAAQTPNPPKQIEVAVAEDGRYEVDNQVVSDASVDGLATALKNAAANENEPVVVINADARATHQSVVNVMEAARREGLTRITFATQTAQ